MDRLRTMDSAADAKKNEHAQANAVYWFEHELRRYPALKLDIDTLTTHAARIVPTARRESRGHPCHEVTRLGTKLGLDVIEMPGGHVGFAAHPAEFAD